MAVSTVFTVGGGTSAWAAGPSESAPAPEVRTPPSPGPAPEAPKEEAPVADPSAEPTPPAEATPPIATPPGETPPAETPADEETPAAIDPDLLDADPEPEEPEPTSPAVPEDEIVDPPPQPSGLAVNIEGGRPGELELFRVDPSATSEDTIGTLNGLPYVRVCASPCEQPVRTRSGEAFFVAGREVMPSQPFTLDEYDDTVKIKVRPGPKKMRYAGFGLTVTGAIFVPGGILLAAGFDAGKGVDAAGYSLIGVGVASMAVGIYLIVRGRTLVDVEGRQRGPRSIATLRF